MRAASKGMTYLYAAGALAFTLIRPSVARMLAASILITGTVLAVWSTQQTDILFGWITKTINDDGRIFAAVRPLLGGSEVALVMTDTGKFMTALPATSDLTIAFRSGNAVAGGPAGTAVFAAEYSASLPVSRVIAAFEAADFAGMIYRTNALGVALCSVLIALCAVFVVRVGFGVLFAPVALVTMWLLLHHNSWSWALVPIPNTMIEPLTLGAGAVGAVLGFKSTLKYPTSIVLRVAAAALAIPLVLALQVSGIFAAPLAFGLPPLALVWPALVPTLAAAIIAREGLDLDLLMTGAFLLGLLLMRWLVLSVFRRGFRAAAPTSVNLSPDATGEIGLDTLFRERKET